MGRENHFVPQFYMRLFSNDGKQINLFNFGARKLINNASIKHQCSRRNFYGSAPGIEEALGLLETVAAMSIKQVLAQETLPAPDSSEWVTLLTYIVFQHLRTRSVAQRNDVMVDYFAKSLLENDPKFQGINLDDFVIKNSNAMALPLKVASELLPTASDLRGHLFINDTEMEFLSSDDPVVLHNNYCEGIKYRGVNGWDSRGLQVFWPTSPKVLIALYDPAVYKFGTRSSSITHITNTSDVERLNALQILNALNNIYFATAELGSTVKAQCDKLARSRSSNRVTFVETERVKTGDRQESKIIGSYVPLLPIELSITSIRIRTDARKTTLHGRGHLMRHDYPHDKASIGGETIRYPVKSIVTK